MLALGVAATSALTQARTLEFDVQVAPPPDRVEVVPEPRPGYVWEKGYWRWDESARKYDWNEGRWIEERRGHRYEPHVWEHRGEHWHFRAGHWDDD